VVRDDHDMIELLRIDAFQTLADGMDDYFIFLIGREENEEGEWLRSEV